MPRGLPDYYNPDTVVAQRLVDLGQLLTGTVGLATTDNKGRLVWLDTFGQGLSAWTLGQTGTGVNPVVTDAFCHVPPCSAYLNAASTGGAGSSFMYRYQYLFGANSLGLEWSRLAAGADCDVDVRLYYDNGAAMYYGRAAYFKSDNGLYILDGATSRKIATVPFDAGIRAWLNFKLVIDVANLRYLRLLIGSDQYDLTAYSLASTAEAHEGLSRIYILGQNTAAGAASTYIGHVFLTTDEP